MRAAIVYRSMKPNATIRVYIDPITTELIRYDPMLATDSPPRHIADNADDVLCAKMSRWRVTRDLR